MSKRTEPPPRLHELEDAKTKRFLGSPSIRVNGIDVEYGDREPDEYQAGTRYYNTPQGWKPFPHARLRQPSAEEKLANRQRRIACSCGRILRGSRKTIAEGGGGSSMEMIENTTAYIRADVAVGRRLAAGFSR